jgi:drug/metabolite transporter (DMT)-like permease
MPALQLAGIRQLIAGTLYVTFFLYKKVPLPKGKEWRPILVLSFLNFLMSNGLSTWGVKYISAGLGSIMGAIFPLWLVVIGLFTVKDKLPKKAILGLLLGFGGVCIIYYEHLKDFSNPDFIFGISLSLVATWTWAIATLYTKSQVANFNPYYSLGLQMVISGILLCIITGATGNAIPITEIPRNSWLAIIYLIVFGSVIAFVCYLYALQRLPTEQVSIYAYINPMIAVLCGSIVFNERVTQFIVIGGIVALLGVFLVNKAFKAMPASEQPETEGV